jgi:hypothetical protein
MTDSASLLRLSDDISSLWSRPGGVFAGLAGRWWMERQVEGAAAFSGIAEFTPRGSFLEKREEGRLRLDGGRSFSASRVTLFAPRPEGFAVHFDETPPRLFHEVRLAPAPDGCLAGDAQHRCGDDSYASFYRFMPDGGFYIRHRAWGPRKTYTMSTLYGRAS